MNSGSIKGHLGRGLECTVYAHLSSSFFGSHYNSKHIKTKNLVRPKAGTTMETIARIQGSRCDSGTSAS